MERFFDGDQEQLFKDAKVVNPFKNICSQVIVSGKKTQNYAILTQKTCIFSLGNYRWAQKSVKYAL